MRSLFNDIVQDLSRKAEWYSCAPDRRSLIRMAFSDGSSAQILYRMMRWCQTHHLKPMAMVLYRINAGWSKAIIGRGAEIGPGLVILHSIGVVINSEVRAGRNLVLEHGVTLGAEKGQSPVLGDDVFIGVGAVVIGGVRIGDRAKIGANAVVTKDVPDGATAVGVPAKVVRIDGRRVGAGVGD